MESFSDIDMLAVELNQTKGERQPSTSHAEKQEEKETPGKILENISEVPKLTVERAKKRAKSVACLLTSPEHIQKCRINQVKKQNTTQKTSGKMKSQRPLGGKKSYKTTPSSSLRKKRKDSSDSSFECTNDESDDETCIICGEQGTSELWYRYISCGT